MIRSVAILLATAATLAAANTYPIQWAWRDIDMSGSKIFPWQRVTPERVDIDVSPDGGSTWFGIAKGVPSTSGTNTYYWSIPDRPEYLSNAATIRIRDTARAPHGLPLDMQKIVRLCGIHFIAVPDVVTNGTLATISWVAAAAGDFVTLSTLSQSDTEWQSQAVLASTDSNSGAYTNTAQWSVSGMTPGGHLIMLKSLEHPLCLRGAVVDVVDE